MNKKKQDEHLAMFFTAFSVILLLLGLVSGNYLTQQETEQRTFSYDNPISSPSPSPYKIKALYTCPASSSQSYTTLTTYRPRPNPESNPELNLSMRSYTEVNQKAELIFYGGDTDPVMPPNFGTLFPNRLPSMIKSYSVYSWDYANNRRGTGIETNWPVNLIGLYTNPGEPIVGPTAGRDIGGGHVLMVLYATENLIVFTHSYADLFTNDQGNWQADGYLIYVDDICVDRNLLNIYQQQNAAGRGSLPVIATGQVFGYGKGVDIKVGIRDSMDWMDPRSQKDWWQGFNSLPPPPAITSPIPTQPDNTPVPTGIYTPTPTPTRAVTDPTLTPTRAMTDPTLTPTRTIANPTPTSTVFNPTLTPTPNPYLILSPTSANPTTTVPLPTDQRPSNPLTPSQSNPTAIIIAPSGQIQPSSVIAPTITLTPTPTKTLKQKITDSPVIKFIGNIKEKVLQLILVMLP